MRVFAAEHWIPINSKSLEALESCLNFHVVKKSGLAKSDYHKELTYKSFLNRNKTINLRSLLDYV